MKILITSVGTNTAISVIKGLKLANLPDIEVFGVDINPEKYCPGTAWVNNYIQAPYANSEEYENWILQVIERYKIDCVIPIHDFEIDAVSKIAQKYPEATFWSVNTPKVIASCNNKNEANTFVAKLGIAVPAWSMNFSDINFPVISKPINGVSSQGLCVFKNKNEINVCNENIIYQEFIEGGVEYTVDCFSLFDGNFYNGLARERLVTKAGISTKGITVDLPELVEMCKLILNSISYVGASNIQFIKKDNKYYFIEINPRFSGAGILSYKAGLNSPLYTLLCAKGQKLESVDGTHIKYGLIMTRYWEEVFSHER